MKESRVDESPVGSLDQAEALAGTLSAGELVIATIVGFDPNGSALVAFKLGADRRTEPAMATVSLQNDSVGRQVAIMFVAQDPARPIVIGLIKSRLDDLLETMAARELAIEDSGAVTPESEARWVQKGDVSSGSQHVQVDGKKVVVEGEEEIVLRCGESSITLTKSGKILIRGKYLLNRSSGVNRIMGGSVQVN